MNELLSNAAERAIRYLEGLDERRVFPSPEACERLAELEFDFPEEPTSRSGCWRRWMRSTPRFDFDVNPGLYYRVFVNR